VPPTDRLRGDGDAARRWRLLGLGAAVAFVLAALPFGAAALIARASESWIELRAAIAVPPAQLIAAGVGLPHSLLAGLAATVPADGRLVVYAGDADAATRSRLGQQRERLANLLYPRPRDVTVAADAAALQAQLSQRLEGRLFVLDSGPVDAAPRVAGEFERLGDFAADGLQLRLWRLRRVRR
jgi:hypothetical protein